MASCDRDKFILRHVAHRFENLGTDEKPNWQRVQNSSMIKDLDETLANQWLQAIDELGRIKHPAEINTLIQSWLVRAHRMSPTALPHDPYLRPEENRTREIL